MNSEGMASSSRLSRFRLWLLPVAMLCAAGMWTYVNRVMIQQQLLEAKLNDRPRGNLSDLYPHWAGARELLLNGRDPYSLEVTQEIQLGYYGRVLDPARRGDPKDQQAFAYPPYVAFYLAPTLHMQFRTVQRIFFYLLLALTFSAIPLWLRVLRWPLPLCTQASIMLFTLGSLTVVIGLKLQQLTLLVFALLATAIALLTAGWPVTAGIFLALSTIKPQLVWLLLLWLVIWTLTDWRRRYRWMASFLITMAILSLASEWYLPHWIPRFFAAMQRYLSYTDAVSILDQMVPKPLGLLLRTIVASAVLWLGWKNRRRGEKTTEFAAAAALIISATIIIIPSYALYNQILILPALLLLLRDRQRIRHHSRIGAVLLGVTAIFLCWPWFSSTALAALSFVFPPVRVARAWALPAWTVPQLSVAVTVLTLIHYYQMTFDAAPKATSS
jgi:hypothetical protein